MYGYVFSRESFLVDLVLQCEDPIRARVDIYRLKGTDVFPNQLVAPIERNAPVGAVAWFFELKNMRSSVYCPKYDHAEERFVFLTNTTNVSPLVLKTKTYQVFHTKSDNINRGQAVRIYCLNRQK